MGIGILCQDIRFLADNSHYEHMFISRCCVSRDKACLVSTIGFSLSDQSSYRKLQIEK